MTQSFNIRDWYWIVASDETKAYSTAAAGFVPIDQADAEKTSRIASMDDLIGELRKRNMPPYHRVSSYRIVRRLEDAGVAAQALAIIDAPQNAVLKARFFTIDVAGGIPADDPEARALITAAGADPDVILAPE